MEILESLLTQLRDRRYAWQVSFCEADSEVEMGGGSIFMGSEGRSIRQENLVCDAAKTRLQPAPLWGSRAGLALQSHPQLGQRVQDLMLLCINS